MKLQNLGILRNHRNPKKWENEKSTKKTQKSVKSANVRKVSFRGFQKSDYSWEKGSKQRSGKPSPPNTLFGVCHVFEHFQNFGIPTKLEKYKNMEFFLVTKNTS